MNLLGESSPVSYFLAFPLLAAIIYALSSILLKRAMKEGAAMEQTFHLSSFCLAALFFPLIFLESKPIEWNEVWKPALTALAFFLGNLTTFLAIRAGDVSLVTPLMGTKVVFVAVAVVFMMNRVPSTMLWIASALTAAGIFLMGWSDFRKKTGEGAMKSIIIALFSAGFFALQDVMLATWAEGFGPMSFMSIEMVVVALCSFSLWIVQGRPNLKMSGPSMKFGIAAGVLISIQALCMGIALAFYDNATGINIVYASRGLWAIVLIAIVGNYFGNDERRSAGKAFRWRLMGTVLVTISVIIAVMEKR